MTAAPRSSAAALDSGRWQRRLDELAARHGVPGAALGILRCRPDGDDSVELATGVLNTATGVAATPDSVFQIGSISKVWTATLAAQLVDEGLLDLDAPVIGALPELRLSDQEAARTITMRHLLSHTSGIDGDFIEDTGRGDDCLEKFVALLPQAQQIFPVGATHAYCNAGFSLAGRVIEKVTGMTWDRALRERISRPLGLELTMTLAEEAILHRAAVGHMRDETSGEPAPVTHWMIPRSAGPAGIIISSVGDVLRFARMHLSGGAGADGREVLSERMTRVLAEQQAVIPNPHVDVQGWGLGWKLFDWDGERVLGHDGACTGQKAYLRIVPSQGIAVVVLMNTLGAEDFPRTLLQEIFEDIAGLGIPEPAEPAEPAARIDPARHVGVYERHSVRIEVAAADDGLRMRVIPTMLLEGERGTPSEFRLHPLDATGDNFALRIPGSQSWSPVAFFALPDGRPCLHHGLRIAPKTA